VETRRYHEKKEGSYEKGVCWFAPGMPVSSLPQSALEQHLSNIPRKKREAEHMRLCLRGTLLPGPRQPNLTTAVQCGVDTRMYCIDRPHWRGCGSWR